MVKELALRCSAALAVVCQGEQVVVCMKFHFCERTLDEFMNKGYEVHYGFFQFAKELHTRTTLAGPTMDWKNQADWASSRWPNYQT